MKKAKKIVTILLLTAVTISMLCAPAFAVTESEVEAQVAASGKGAVAGNVLIWFLCAVAFLKVSQKIDSFMASLGVNVGRTGGSLMADAMIAMRSVSLLIGGGRGAGRTGAVSGAASGKSGSSGMAGFFKGGLIGMTGRHITNSAVKTATTQTSAVQSQMRQASAAASAGQAASDAHINSAVNMGGSDIHTENNISGGTGSQDGMIATGGGVSASAASIESGPSFNASPDNMPPQEGIILTGDETPPSISQADPMPQPMDMPTDSIPVDLTPPQEGVVLTGSEAPSITQADSMSQAVDTPPDVIPADLTPPQDGVVLTGSEPPPIASQTDSVITPADTPVESIPGSITPLPEGTALSGSEPPLVVPQSNSSTPATGTPAESIPVSGTPPQEGTILTGSEPPPAVSQTEPIPPMTDTPLESVSGDTVSSQESVVLTGGGTTIHAPQDGNVPPSGSTVTTPQENSGGGRQVETHTERTTQMASHTISNERVQTSRSHLFGAGRPSLGGMVFSHSLQSGGSFANDVIGTIARGEVSGSITGDMAAQSMQSYLGYTREGREPLVFSNTEIGRGRITGQVSTASHPEPIAFGMYHVDQYAEPTGQYSKIRSADGTLWYTQLAQDAVERKPYMASEDKVAYKERIIKKLPDPPKRKDRI